MDVLGKDRLGNYYKESKPPSWGHIPLWCPRKDMSEKYEESELGIMI